MTETPPPPPPASGIELPLNTVKTIAKYYVQFSWLIPILARMTGNKIPPELDMAMKALAASDDPAAVQNLQQLALGQKDPYNIQQQEIPEPRIGEPVLTQDLAWRAWQLHHEQGLSLREIAAYFTQEVGAPCSHATIANYINEIDEVMEENRGTRLRTALKYVVLIGVPFVCALLVGHFFL